MQTWIMGLVVLMYLIDLAVTLINDRHSRQPLPPQARGIYDDETCHKWLQYALVTSRHVTVTKTVKTSLLLTLLALGAFGSLERWTDARVEHPLLQTLAFWGIVGLVDWVVGLPFDYYRTFVIEEQFGFNQMTRRTFILDMLKTILLTGLLGSGMVSLLYLFYTTFAGRLWSFIVSAWGALSVVNVVLFVLTTQMFIKFFYKLTPLPECELKQAIAALANQVGFDVRAVLVMDASKRSTKLNVFFSGLGKTREVVLVDTLLAKLNHHEILSVLAHELGHAARRDNLRVLVLQVVWLGI